MSTGTALKGVTVGNTDYPFDYDYLDNKPTAIPDTSGASEGDVLTYSSGDIIWATPESGSADGVPDHSLASEGEVLIVSGCDDGHLIWDYPLPLCNTAGWVLTSNTHSPYFEWADPATLTS